MKKNILSMLLAVCMITSVACSGGGSTVETNAPAIDNNTETVTLNESETDADQLSLPETLDLGGESIRFLLYTEDIIGDVEGDELSSAVYKSRTAAEEQLNFTSEFIMSTDIVADVKRACNSGDDAYDIAGHSGRWYSSAFWDGLLLDIEELPYIDISKPWWYQEYMYSVSPNINNINVLISDMTNSPIGSLYVVYMNKRLMNSTLDISDVDLYQMVLDGKWTLDQFTEFSKDFYQDVNGNGKNDKEDMHAFVVQDHWTLEAMAYSAGLCFTSRDDDGFPVLDMNNQNTVDLLDKLLAVVFSEDCYRTSENAVGTRFANGQSLMCLERLYAASWWFRDMEDDYCIIPMPKFDETIETYHSVNEGNIQWYGVPMTAERKDSISGVIEALSYYGYQNIRPTFIELSLKTKYARDDMSSQMIDLAINNARTDFLYIYSPSGRVGSLPSIFERIYKKKQNVFASQYEQLAKSTLTALEELKEINE